MFEGHEKLRLGIEVIGYRSFHGDLLKKWKLEAETHTSNSLIVLANEGLKLIVVEEKF